MNSSLKLTTSKGGTSLLYVKKENFGQIPPKKNKKIYFAILVARLPDHFTECGE